MSPMYVALVALGGTIAGAAGTLLTKLLPSRGETAESDIAQLTNQLVELGHVPVTHL